MMLKTMQFNDDLPLRLGARVTLRPEEMKPQWVGVDIDLSVRWVGDIMDDEVQVTDMVHPSTPQTSEKFGRQLFGVDGGIPAELPRFEPIKYEDLYPDAARIGRELALRASIAKCQTATGMQMLQAGAERAMRQWLTGDFETPTEYTIEGVGGYTRQEYESFERRKAGGLAHWTAAMMAKTERESRLARRIFS